LNKKVKFVSNLSYVLERIMYIAIYTEKYEKELRTATDGHK
jgi:hypothetical protein